MTGSIVPTVIDRLVDQLSGGSFEVFDGPGRTDDRIMSGLFVGWSDLEDEGPNDGVSWDQSWPFLGHYQRDETVRIACVAVAWSGNSTMKPARDEAFAMVDAVGALIQEDPTLGTQTTPVDGVVMLAVQGMTAGKLRQNLDNEGAYAELGFEIEVKGRVS